LKSSANPNDFVCRFGEMARTKNACVPLAVASAAEVVVSQTINDEVVVASAVEVDSEATNSISNDDRAV